MLAGETLHYWFPTYNSRFKKYSPGSELILRVAEEAALRGITKIDFGYGDDPYKFRFCNRHDQVLCGLAHPSAFSRKVAGQVYKLRNQLKQMPYKPLAKAILRQVYPGFGHWNYR
jgi:CelD/BcsL family acetyltransferase involved in cellulose biosynthesis